MLQCEPLICNPFAQNTFIVYDDETKEAFAVDAGMYEESERLAFERFLKQRGLRLKFLINTHLHLDHVFGNRFVTETYQIPDYYHSDDEFLLDELENQAALFGLAVETIHHPVQSSHSFSGEKELLFCGRTLQLWPVPGHSPGSILIVIPSEKICFSGDLLFRGGVGRTDLSGGNSRQLKESLSFVRKNLAPETMIFPGHGLSTTAANERKYNPFFI